VRKARRLLADRRDPEVIFPLRRIIQQTKDDNLALQALWALYVSGGFNDGFADKLLDNANPHVRRWTARLLGDEEKVGPALAKRLAELASNEKDVTVRSQLASSARRLPANEALPIVIGLLQHADDASDAHLPLLLWWAVERHAVSGRAAVLKHFAVSPSWKNSFVRDAILGKLMRRWAADATESSLLACADLLTAAPNEGERMRLLAGLDQGLQDRAGLSAHYTLGSLFTELAPPKNDKTQHSAPLVLPPELSKHVTGFWKADLSDPMLLRLLSRIDHLPAQKRVLHLAADKAAPLPTRLAMLRIINEATFANQTSVLLGLLMEREPEAIHLAVLDALRRFDSDEVARWLVRLLPSQTGKVRSRAIDTLLSRKQSARLLLQAVDQDKLPAKDIAVEQLRVVTLHQDKTLDALVRKHWGNIAGGTPEEKLAEMRRLSNDLRAGKGDAEWGKRLFEKHCANCHQLFGEGTKLGPDLTHANRQDRDFLLQSLVDPSAVIRREYLVHIVETKSGQVLTGVIVEQTPNKLTLANAKNDRESVEVGQIATIRESPVSLMPDDLHRQLRPQELRDLFAYLQKK
jgi:putative heme-binding domain-containing protein